MYNPVTTAPERALWSEDAKCNGQFHRPKDKKPYWKPDRLVHELKKLFNDIPVVNPVEALKRLAVLKDNTDGGLLFCYSKRGEIRKYGQKTQEYIDWEGCSMCKKNHAVTAMGNYFQRKK